MGIIPERYNEVFQTRDYFIEGSLTTLNENKAVIGDRLAELMDLEIDDYIILLVRTKEDTFNTIDVEIGGIVRTLNPMLNSNIVLLPLELVQQRLNVENSISMISLKTAANQEEVVRDSLHNKIDEHNMPISVYSWRESAANVIALSTTKKSGIGKQ